MSITRTTLLAAALFAVSQFGMLPSVDAQNRVSDKGKSEKVQPRKTTAGKAGGRKSPGKPGAGKPNAGGIGAKQAPGKRGPNKPTAEKSPKPRGIGSKSNDGNPGKPLPKRGVGKKKDGGKGSGLVPRKGKDPNSKDNTTDSPRNRKGNREKAKPGTDLAPNAPKPVKPRLDDDKLDEKPPVRRREVNRVIRNTGPDGDAKPVDRPKPRSVVVTPPVSIKPKPVVVAPKNVEINSNKVVVNPKTVVKPKTVIVNPKPVVVTPTPVVKTPRPVVVRPRPVVVAPPPVVVTPPPAVAPAPVVVVEKPAKTVVVQESPTQAFYALRVQLTGMECVESNDPGGDVEIYGRARVTATWDGYDAEGMPVRMSQDKLISFGEDSREGEIRIQQGTIVEFEGLAVDFNIPDDLRTPQVNEAASASVTIAWEYIYERDSATKRNALTPAPEALLYEAALTQEVIEDGVAASGDGNLIHLYYAIFPRN